jgi:O-antigen/teichoic acid export membrane protein
MEDVTRHRGGPGDWRGEARVLAGRAGWNVADQVVSSGTNFLLSLLVARALSAEGFGYFAVAFTIYVFLTGAARALIHQPLVVRYTAVRPGAFKAAARSATGVTTLIGIFAGIVTGTIGILIGGRVGLSLVCMGVLLPGLLLQDMWRAVFVTEGRPAAAFVNDVVWGLMQVAALVAVIRLGYNTAAAMLLAWGCSALLAALLGGVQFGAHPQFRRSIAWLLQQKDLLGYYGAGFFGAMGASQVTLLLIAGLGQPSDIGAIRAAQVVLGPLTLIGISLMAFVLPEISRRQLSGRAAVKVAAALSAVLVVADVLWGAVLLALPDRWGTVILGDTWMYAKAVLPASLLGLVAIGVAFGAQVLMIARGFAKEFFWATALLGPGFLVLGLGGLQLWGAPGAALGLSLAQCVIVPLAWWRALSLMRREHNEAASCQMTADDNVAEQ